MTFSYYERNCISVEKYVTAIANKYQCVDCSQESFITGSDPVVCQLCDPGCRKCAATGSCLVPKCDVQGLFYEAQSNSCQFCFVSCSGCTSSSFYSCTMCKEGFYFSQNSYNSVGSCLQCHSSCKTCWGPALTDCVEPARGFYIANKGTAAANTVACDPNCAACEGSATYCTSCVFDFLDPTSYQLDMNTHTCSLFDTFIVWQDCLEYVLYPDTSTGCNYCTSELLVHPWNRECVNALTFSKCTLHTVPEDPREINCLDCKQANGLNVLTGDCRNVGTAGDNCKVRMIYAQKPFCMQCEPGWYADVATGLCVAACSGGYINVFFGGGDVCFPAPPGCLAATIDGTNELFCTTCDTANNFIKDQPTDKQCINLVCNNNALTLNKQCTPVVNPGLCDSNLCFWTNNLDECPTPSTCARKVFQIKYSDRGFVIQVTQAYSFYLRYDMADYTVYDSSVAGEKRVFCKLVSDDLNDELSRCTYKNGALYIDVIDLKYRQIVVQGSITLKPSAFKVYRKLLDIQNNNIMDPGFGYGFAINTNCPLSSQLTKGSSNWIAVYQSDMPWTDGIRAEIFQATNKYSLQSYSWTCISVGADTVLRDQLNGILSGFNNKPLSILMTNVAFQNKLIVLQATVTDEYGQNHALTLSFTLVTNTPLFVQPKVQPVFFTYRDTGVYVPLVTSTSSINMNNVVVTGVDLEVGGSISSSFTALSGHYLLKVVVTNIKDFKVKVSYPGRSDLILQFVYLAGNYPSSIIYEQNAGNNAPWVFHLANRQSIFKVYCVDETTATSCLPGSANTRVFAPGESVALQDNFIFAADRQVTIFFRVSNYADETITSVTLNGKLTAQLQTPVLTYKANTMAPESPYHESTLNFYLDSRTSVITGLGSSSSPYVDAQTLTSSGTTPFSVDTTNLQISQTGPAVSAHFFKSKLQFSLDGGALHSLVEARFISPSQTHTLQGKIVTGNADFNNLEISSELLPSGNTCNDSPFQFTHVYTLDQKVHIAETSRYMRRSVMLGTFINTPIAVEATTYTYCGPQKSTAVNVVDTTGLTFSSTLQAYLNKLLLNLGSSARDQLNNLNVALYHLMRGLDDCVASASTCRVSADNVRTQAVTLLSKIPATFENNRFGMLVRYSFLNGFITGQRLVSNDNLLVVLQAIEATSTYISDKLEVPMGAHPRLSHDLSVAVSNLDLLLPELLDYPLTVGSNLLNAFLFGYNKDTDRNDMVKRAINQIVKHKEFKMLRSSAHKRLEVYQDASIKVQAMTVLEPLDPTYQFLLSDSSLLVFKGIRFAAAASYYEIVIISWETGLLTRMKPVYNQTTSDYEKRNFYVDFMNYFKQNTPIEGEVQVYSQECTPTAATATCTVVTLSAPYDTYKFCDCIPAPTVTGLSPTASPLPPVTPPINPGTGTGTDPNTPGGTGTTTPKPSSPLVPPSLSENKSKLSPERWANYKLWGISTLIIEGLLLVLLILHLVLQKKLLKMSMEYCKYLGSKMLVHKLLDRAEKDAAAAPDARLQIYEDQQQVQVANAQSVSSKESALGQTKNHYFNLRKFHQVDLVDLEEKEFTRLGFVAHYLRYLLLAHNFTTIHYLKSNRHSKSMQILFVFMRLFLHLALSMFFTLGSFEQQDGLTSDNWIVKIIYVPLPLWLFNLIARLLLARTNPSTQSGDPASTPTHKVARVVDVEDFAPVPAQENRPDVDESCIKRTESNQQLVGIGAGFKKLSSGSTGDNSPAEASEPHNPLVSRKGSHNQQSSFSSNTSQKGPKRSTNLRGNARNSVTPNQSKIIRKSFSQEELNQPVRVRLPSESAIPITLNTQEAAKPHTPQKPHHVAAVASQPMTPEQSWWEKNWLLRKTLGFLFIGAVMAGSAYIIFSISLGGDRDNTNWPWGLWYFFSLLIDVFMIQPVFAFGYFILVWRFYNCQPIGCCGGILTAMLISSDVRDAFSMHLHHLNALEQ